jgi:hypothetical protein
MLPDLSSAVQRLRTGPGRDPIPPKLYLYNEIQPDSL